MPPNTARTEPELPRARREAAMASPSAAAEQAAAPAASPTSRIAAAFLATIVALVMLVAFALVWIDPVLSPTVVIATVAVAAVAFWGAARIDREELDLDRERLARENKRLAEKSETLADIAWELRESEERYRGQLAARHKAEAASLAKSRLLATVSHEFRTPLNGILGLSGLIAETELTPDQATYIRGVRSSGEALLALVDDMLDFSRIEAGRLDLKPEPTELEALLQEIAELLAGRAHGKGIDIAVAIGAGVPTRVLVDPARLRQVLINLAGNGVKFTDQGGVVLSIDAGDGGLVFSVADTGPGIPPEDAERLFNEFEQADSALSRRHGGAGLGLAIARRIVRSMGGDIALRPRDGGGSVFSFVLSPPAVGAESLLAPADLAGRRILILGTAGAEPPVLAEALKAAGASSRLARTLAEAAGLVGAAAAAGETHSAILIDARAVADAGAALIQIREAAGDEVPAAVLIEPSQRSAIESLRAAGFDAYLVKPVRRQSLMRVAAGIAGRRPERFQIDPGDQPAAKPPAPRRATTGLDVLLAEDNEINALLARAVLEGLGHAVTEVHDGNAAVAAVRARPEGFGAVLMDLHMPGLDGIAAARAIRALEATGGTPRTPILAVTADVLADTGVEARAAGIDVVIEKPMTPDRLRQALADLAAA